MALLAPLTVTLLDHHGGSFPLCLAPPEYLLRTEDPRTGEARCVPAIERGSPHQSVPVILGLVFLRTYTTIFDLDEHRIGFARGRITPQDAPAASREELERDVFRAWCPRWGEVVAEAKGNTGFFASHGWSWLGLEMRIAGLCSMPLFWACLGVAAGAALFQLVVMRIPTVRRVLLGPDELLDRTTQPDEANMYVE
ncbi:unnamed protein product [Amoebophrya sp. A25]|nr:unnamed protein product [Amoebophrya sp. A25]|eukprot:GSA25T00008209001.1